MSLRINRLRRRVCQGAALAAAGCVWPGFGTAAEDTSVGADHGRLKPPRPLPDIIVRCSNGESVRLHQLLEHRVTAIQLMFTQCTTVCPIQGVIFSRVQVILTDSHAQGAQLLSLSVDPVHDSPRVLRGWLKHFGARRDWIGAAPEVNDLPQVLGSFGQQQTTLAGHATQVNISNRQGELIWRTGELPPPESIADILRKA
jgi:protein SCO1/2